MSGASVWLYKRTVADSDDPPAVFTVGFYDPAGKWFPESDHLSSEAAAARVHWLNGGEHERK